MDSVEKRRNSIVNWINEKGEVTFAQLKEAFPNVSDMTLRTDLKNLDDIKRIVRIHGGARSVDVVVGTDDFMSRRSIRNVDAKKAIIMKAKELVAPGTAIFLDSGSTTTMLAAELKDQPNLIITSSISCAMELARLEKAQVVIPGGTMNRYSLSICGSQGAGELQKMKFDLAFMGVTTYNDDTGFACNVYEESQLKQTVINRAQKTVVLMDSTKVGKNSTFTFGSLKDVDVVISDGNLPEVFLAACRENNVEVLYQITYLRYRFSNIIGRIEIVRLERPDESQSLIIK